MRLGRKEFLEVVARAPLVSIDLIVQRADGRVLLGKRRNEPAKDYWFVPGGRIHKNETLERAFRRICRDELGKEFSPADAQFRGVFEHFYDTNFAEEPGFGTHYVVLAYRLTSAELPDQLPDEQHHDFQWFDPAGILHLDSIHPHTKAYFPATRQLGEHP